MSRLSFADLFEKQFVLSRETDSKLREETESTVVSIYRLLGKDPPAIVWCKSIYQLATIPSILMAFLHSPSWSVIESTLGDHPPTDNWRKEYDEAWTHLWSTCGNKILRGLNDTSRISEYFEQEALLVRQCKSEFARLLVKNELAPFNNKLPKETIYRRYWGLHRERSFLLDRAKSLEQTLLFLLFEQMSANAQTATEFQPFVNRVLSTSAGANASLNSLMNTMGAEPQGQLNFALKLPFDLAQTILSALWIKILPHQHLLEYEKELSLFGKLAENIYAITALEDLAFVCEKPIQYSADEGDRLHSELGPALAFSDGMKGYFWHGVPVDARLILDPGSITIEEIESTRNIELRRVLVERFGPSRYLQECGAEEIHRDSSGVLYKREIENDEALVMVKVTNSTAEPDGSFREYFLRVPPDMVTARQAVAWTFGMTEESYQPLQET